MTVKSILEVDVDDTSFQAYQQSFQKYQNALAQLPSLWRNVTAQANNTAAAFADVGAALMAHAELLERSSRSHEQLQRSSNLMVSSFRNIDQFVYRIANNIFSMTTSLLKVSGLVAAAGGLVGFGGIWGLERLAQTAAGGRRGALGLGATYGEAQTFGPAFERFADPGQLLGGVTTAMTDPSQSWRLRAAGPAALATGDAVKIATAMLPEMQRVLQQTPVSQLATRAQALGWDQFLTPESMMRLHQGGAAAQQEMQQLQRLFREQARQADLIDRTAKAWQDLITQLGLSKVQIETVLIRGLAPLAPSLKSLSEAFTHIIESLGQAPVIRKIIDDVASGLSRFAEYLKSEDFGKDLNAFKIYVKEFADEVREMVKGVGDVRSIFDKIYGNLQAFNNALQPLADILNDLAGLIPGGTKPNVGLEPPTEGGGEWGIRPGSPADRLPAEPLWGAVDAMRSLGWQRAAAIGFASSFWHESGLRPHIMGPGGHAGIAQWDAERQKDFAKVFGHDIGHGTASEEYQFVDWEMRHNPRFALLMKQLQRQGISNEEAAALVSRYYESPGATEQQQRSEAFSRAQTATAIDRAYNRRQQQQSVDININNNTGGATTITAGALGGYP